MKAMSRSAMVLFMAVTCLFAADSRDLLVAIRNGDHARVQKLLRAGANVNSRDLDGTTALMHSVLESDVSMMKLLLDSGPKSMPGTRLIPRL
jgi:ankyrin repeat protein